MMEGVNSATVLVNSALVNVTMHPQYKNKKDNKNKFI
jgi:hypothetical protein